MKIVLTESQYNFIVNELNKKEESLNEGILNTIADVVGMYDPTGLVNLGNAISYWFQGKKTFALLTLVSIIPGVSWATKPFVLGAKTVGFLGEIPILGWLIKTILKWSGKALDFLDKMLLSKIPIVKSFANGMRTFIEGLKKDGEIKLNESFSNYDFDLINEAKLYNKLTENIDFDSAYRDYFTPIFKNVCLKYADGDEDKAKDFCQDGFIKAFSQLDKFDGTQENIGGWIARVVRNNTIDTIRKQKGKKVSDFDFDRYDSEEEEYDDRYMGLYDDNDIRSAILELPKKQQEVFNLYYFDDLQHDEIANKLGINVGTSKSQLHKAKKALKNELEKIKEV